MNVDLSITSLQSFNYKLIKDDVYVDLNDTSGFSNYRMAVLINEIKDDFLKLKMERQFEDYLIYIEKIETCNKKKELKYILGGDLEDLENFKSRIKSKMFSLKLGDGS